MDRSPVVGSRNRRYISLFRNSLWFLAGCLVFTACRQGGLHHCQSLLEADQPVGAIAVCGQLWEDSGDPRAGAAVAKAHRRLGQDDEVLAWLERLKGTTEEAQLWYLTANIHRKAGEPELAVEAYSKALTLQREAGNHGAAAKSLYGLFFVGWRTSDYRQALEHLEAAIEEGSQAEDRAIEAMSLRSMVSLLLDLGDREGAQRVLDEAFERSQQDELSIQARLYSHVGILRLSQGRPALAVAALEGALERSTGEEGRSFLRTVRLNLTRAHLELGELADAERHLDLAREQAEPDGRRRNGLLYYQAELERQRGLLDQAAATLDTALVDQPAPDWAWQLETLAGAVAEARGEMEAAVEAYQRAALVIEEMRRSLESGELKAWMLDRKRQPYEALFRLHLADDRRMAAVEALEHAKARSFLDAFIRATAPDRAAASGAAGERLAAAEWTLPAMGESPGVELRPLVEILEVVADRHVLLYFEAEGRFWLVVVADQQFVPYQLAASADEIETRISRLLADIAEPAPSAELARILLPPGSLPLPGTEVHVVTDGALGGLPFAALRHEGRFLVEDHDIRYVPSLSSLASLADSPRNSDGAPFVGGDPHGNLPAAAAEARAVAARLGVEVKTGEALEAAGLLAAGEARVLHLATHGGLGPQGPWLALADGELSVGTVVHERLAPRLVVLASCASGARRGKGIWGSLGGAFLAAGSRAVVASLWSVEDQPTRDFILRFYRAGGANDAAGAIARVHHPLLARAATTSGLYRCGGTTGIAHLVSGRLQVEARRSRQCRW